MPQQQAPGAASQQPGSGKRQQDGDQVQRCWRRRAARHAGAHRRHVRGLPRRGQGFRPCRRGDEVAAARIERREDQGELRQEEPSRRCQQRARGRGQQLHRRLRTARLVVEQAAGGDSQRRLQRVLGAAATRGCSLL